MADLTIRALRLFVPIAALSALFISCGYSFYGADYAPASGKRYNFAVPTFKNATYEAGLENELTTSFRAAFARHPSIDLTSELDADYILNGTVASVSAEVINYSMVDAARADKPGQTYSYPVQNEMMLTLTVEIDLTSKLNGKKLWERERFFAQARYGVPSSKAVQEASRNEAIKEAARYIADDVYSEIVEW